MSIFDGKKEDLPVIMSPPSPDIFVFHRTLLYTYYLRWLGVAYSQYRQADELQFLHKIEYSNWYDLNLIVQAAQFDYLITNDTIQREICNYLRNKGLIRPEGITLDEFLVKLA